MKTKLTRLSALLIVILLSQGAIGSILPKNGTPEIQSMSALAINEDGILFVGDAKQATVFAIQLNDESFTSEEALNIGDIEGDLAEMMGTEAENVLIHDMAVNPISQNVYVSVSRGRAAWSSKWHLPNELADANILFRIKPDGSYEEVSLENVEYSSVEIPNPINTEDEHRWKKGVKQRTHAITEVVIDGNKLYITGLSNEEFSSAMWVTAYPFKKPTMNTVEIFHGAHGKWETASPIRGLLPYQMNNKDYILAAYLCTPLVVFEADAFQDGKHIKGRTVAEFGSGNYPLDMVRYQNKGRDLVLMSNSQLPLMIYDPSEAVSYEGQILEEVEGYTEGINFTARSGSGVQELANYNDKFILATQRMPSGKLALVSLSKEWMIP